MPYPSDRPNIGLLFSSIADSYDRGFVDNPFALANRARFRKVVEGRLPRKGVSVLDFGCGTGDDALYFAQKNHHVVACDISERMIQIARDKAGATGRDVTFVLGDETCLTGCGRGAFRLAYADFGSLNFVDDLRRVCAAIHDLLEPGGFLVASVQNRFCIQESFYLLATGRFRGVCRRWAGRSVAPGSNGVKFPIHYYSPTGLARALKRLYRVDGLHAVGACSFGSFLYGRVPTRIQGLQSVLSGLEDTASRVPLARYALACIGDFFIVELRAR